MSNGLNPKECCACAVAAHQYLTIPIQGKHTVYPVFKPGNAYQFAIGYTNDPYYGTTSGENTSYLVRSKRKKINKQVLLLCHPLCDHERSAGNSGGISGAAGHLEGRIHRPVP